MSVAHARAAATAANLLVKLHLGNLLLGGRMLRGASLRLPANTHAVIVSAACWGTLACGGGTAYLPEALARCLELAHDLLALEELDLVVSALQPGNARCLGLGR